MLDPRSREGERRREGQVQFPREQMHHPLVTPVMVGISLLCILIVVIIVLTDRNGPFIGPWG